MKDPAARQKILAEAINCIEKYGIEGCTIRNIAKEAAIPFSSLHYYFESKEELVNEAMAQAINGSFEDLYEIWKNRTDDLSAVTEILTFLFDGAIRYPGITRAGLYTLLMGGKVDGLFAVKLNEFLMEIALEVSRKHDINENMLSLKLVRAFSSTLFLGISPRAFAQFSSLDFRDAERRNELVLLIINDLLSS